MRIPLMKSFKDFSEKPIGFIEIENDEVPNDPQFCFALGYTYTNTNGLPRVEPICAAIVSDDEYRKFLDSDQSKVR
jgi:hypothetical protein